MKIATVMVVCLVMMLAVAGTASAAAYTDSQINASCRVLSQLSGFPPTSVMGDQYDPITGEMDRLVAAEGITPDTFLAIAGSTSVSTAYDNLGCSERLQASGPTRGALPSTGIALTLLIGSGVVGLGAASRLLKRSN